jgi:hypothetical protein
MQKQGGHRLADDVGAPDHYGMQAFERNLGALEELDHACGCARRETLAVLHQPARRNGAEAVDVLARVDRVEHLLLGVCAEGFRQRRLDQNAVELGVDVEAAHRGQQSSERGRPRQPLQMHSHSGILCGFQLVADVDLRSRIVAHEHDREGRRPAELFAHLLDSSLEFGADLLCDGFAVEDFRGHWEYSAGRGDADSRTTLFDRSR